MDGWYALCLSILKNHTPDVSMAIIENEKMNRGGGFKPLDDSVPEDMIRMREEGKTWAAIGKAFNVSPDNAYRRVQRYKKRKGT